MPWVDCGQVQAGGADACGCTACVGSGRLCGASATLCLKRGLNNENDNQNEKQKGAMNVY